MNTTGREFSVTLARENWVTLDSLQGAWRVGALLRREGLYSSHLSAWRKQCQAGAVNGLKAKNRGPKVSRDKVLHERVAQLEQENTRLRRQLEEARVINEFQKKACEMLGIPLRDRASSEGA